MSLQGTLDTFSLPDVLRFLAASSKTGRLVVSSDRGGGDVWLDDGAVVAAETERATEPVDAVFDLLRDDEGSFTFDADLTRSDGVEPLVVDDLVAQAEARLTEWRDIEAVVPSLAVRVRLADDIPGGAVRIESDQWRALVAVADSGIVSAVAERLELGEFDACRTVKELAERGLVAVGDGEITAINTDDEDADETPARAASKALKSDDKPEKAEKAEKADASKVRRSRRDDASTDDGAPEIDEDLAAEIEKLGPEAAKAMEAAARATTEEERERVLAGVDDDDPNRGLLLKFLSSVRT